VTEPVFDDRTLVASMMRGDERAFDAFVDEYYPRLYRFAHRRTGGDRQATQDIVQGTFEKAIAAISGYRGEAALFTWLCGICRHELAAHWKRTGRERVNVSLVEDSPDVRAALESLAATEDGPEAQLVRKELARLVRVALDHLPLRYAKALEWKYIAGLPVVEIGSRLELSPKAAESLLTRARQSFRDSFGELVGGRIS
jgi:RNA polymerase sigma-70 factor (ECF subfamily)